MMIPEDAASVAKYMYRIKSIVGGDYYFAILVAMCLKKHEQLSH